MRVRTIGIILVALAAIGLAGCRNNNDAGQKAESGIQQSNYDQLAQAQKAHRMTYSPTRDSINAWIDTWNVRGQLAFTYMLSNGEKIGYYVFQGPPVSYCASLTPNYKLIDPGGSDNNGDITVNAPSIDGVFYSGGQCATYYGKDATTGQIIEFSIGNGLNYVTTTQPLYLNLPAYGYTKISDVHPNAKGQYVK